MQLLGGFICYLNYIAFNLSKIIIKKIGNNIITVFGKIMGLIIAIIGTGMVIEGIDFSLYFIKTCQIIEIVNIINNNCIYYANGMIFGN